MRPVVALVRGLVALWRCLWPRLTVEQRRTMRRLKDEGWLVDEWRRTIPLAYRGAEVLQILPNGAVRWLKEDHG